MDHMTTDELASGLQERGEVVRRMEDWLQTSQLDSEPYEVTILGFDFVVLPGVFSPRYYPETAFYAEYIMASVGAGARFLDMGCGIGVNAVLGALSAADVVACDVNPQAVRNTERNAARHEVAVDVRTSDVFSAIGAEERFDMVYWNVPFAFRQPRTALTMLEEAVFDPGYRKNLTFVRTVSRHLAPGGVVLLGVSSSLGEVEVIQSAAVEAGLRLEVRASTLEAGTEPPTWLQLLAGRVR